MVACAEGLPQVFEARPGSLQRSCTLITPPRHIIRVVVTPPLP
jgi:hypothetical protein